MAELISRVETEILVDHGSFDLIDDSGATGVLTCAPPGDGWLAVVDNEVMVRSPLAYHTAGVAVEAWDAEPVIGTEWEAVQDARLRCASGMIDINPLIEGEDTVSIDVGGPGVYGIRVAVTGRAALIALGPHPEDEPVGVEHYLVQFWPVESS